MKPAMASVSYQRPKSNKSLDVRQKQLLFKILPFNSELRVAGFAPRQLNR
jgi:hypothetical protein